MQHRYLGNSGFKVSVLTYGNWLTHASQIDDKAAHATVHAALEGGITSFDTADVYANQAAEAVLGEALRGQRREGIEIFTKVYWPVAAKGPNDTGLSRKHIMESINGSLKRLQTDYVDLYQAHRFDVETPLEETMQAFADIVRAGKALYIGVSEWNAEQIRAAHKLSKELGFQLISNQPQYSALGCGWSRYSARNHGQGFQHLGAGRNHRPSRNESTCHSPLLVGHRLLTSLRAQSGPS